MSDLWVRKLTRFTQNEDSQNDVVVVPLLLRSPSLGTEYFRMAEEVYGTVIHPTRIGQFMSHFISPHFFQLINKIELLDCAVNYPGLTSGYKS